MLTQEGKPRWNVATREEDCVSPFRFDQRTRFVHPSELTEDREQEAPQRGQLRPGPLYGRSECALGIVDSTERNRRLRAGQSCRPSPSRSRWNARPEIEGNVGFAPRRLAAAKFEEHFRISGPAARKLHQSLARQNHAPGFHILARFSQLKPQPLGAAR